MTLDAKLTDFIIRGINSSDADSAILAISLLDKTLYDKTIEELNSVAGYIITIQYSIIQHNKDHRISILLEWAVACVCPDTSMYIIEKPMYRSRFYNRYELLKHLAHCLYYKTYTDPEQEQYVKKKLFKRRT
jgi:hypothetical protein